MTKDEIVNIIKLSAASPNHLDDLGGESFFVKLSWASNYIRKMRLCPETLLVHPCNIYKIYEQLEESYAVIVNQPSPMGMSLDGKMIKIFGINIEETKNIPKDLAILYDPWAVKVENPLGIATFTA